MDMIARGMAASASARLAHIAQQQLFGRSEPIAISDNFTRADSATLGSPWVNVQGTLGITGNKCVAKTYNGSGGSRADVDVGTSDFVFSADITFVSGETPALVFRSDGTNNNRMQLYVDGTNAVFRKVIAGTATVLATVPYPLTNGQTITVSVSAQGDAFTASINGTEIISLFDSNALTSYKTACLQLYKLNTLAASTFDNVSITGTKDTLWSTAQWVSFGDSVTEAGTYQQKVLNVLGLYSVDNQGLGGQSMADNASGTPGGIGGVTRILAKAVGAFKLATIFYGTNDFRYSVALGSIGAIGDTVFDRDTFYGAYRVAIEYLLTQNPLMRIILVTPTQRDKDSYDVNYTNSAGNKLIAYVDAIVALGAMYGLPVIDLYRTSGFTKKTLATLTTDGLHPNRIGAEVMGDVIARKIAENGIFLS